MRNLFQPYKAIIKNIVKETNDISTYEISFVDSDLSKEYSFIPGQFNMMTIFGYGEAPISVSSDPEQEESFYHTIRHVGKVTNALSNLKPGSIIGIRGSYGRGWPMEELEGKDVLIIAGGIGLAPLRPVITQITSHRDKYKQVEILYGAKTPRECLFKNEFEDWNSMPETVFRATVDKVPEGELWNGEIGLVTALFDSMLTKPDNAVILICGPEIMMKFAVKGLLAKGFSPEQIYVSMERRMKCGIGKCGNCQIGPKFVCKDGPVFTYKELSMLAEEVF